MKKSKKVKLTLGISGVIMITSITIPLVLVLNDTKKDNDFEDNDKIYNWEQLYKKNNMPLLSRQHIIPTKILPKTKMEYNPVEFDKIRENRINGLTSKNYMNDTQSNIGLEYKFSDITIKVQKKLIKDWSLKKIQVDNYIKKIIKQLNITELRHIAKVDIEMRIVKELSLDLGHFTFPDIIKMNYDEHWIKGNIENYYGGSIFQHEYGHYLTIDNFNGTWKALKSNKISTEYAKTFKDFLQKNNFLIMDHNFRTKFLKNNNYYKNLSPWLNLKNISSNNNKFRSIHADSMNFRPVNYDATEETLTRTMATITDFSYIDNFQNFVNNYQLEGMRLWRNLPLLDYPYSSAIDSKSNEKIADMWLKNFYGINNKHGIKVVREDIISKYKILFQSANLNNTKQLKNLIIKDSSNKIIKTIPIKHEKEIFGFNQIPWFLTNDYDHKYVYDSAYIPETNFSSIDPNIKYILELKDGTFIQDNDPSINLSKTWTY